MKTEQLYDCAGITLNSNEVFEFICCDCGLKHHMVMVSEDNKPIGFAVKRVKRPISEGGKLMPPVPTRAMSNAGKHYLKGADTTFERELAEGVYQVMFAVAPVVALGGEKGEAVAETENALRPDHPLAKGSCVHGESMAKHCAWCSARPVGKARMLTDEEADHITGMHNTGRAQGDSECAEAIQRKFCEVNGITLEGGNRSGG